MSKKHTYLLAWTCEKNGVNKAYFEFSTSRLCRTQGIINAGVERDGHRVTVYCDYIHGDDYLTKEELRDIATCYLDDAFKVVQINLCE